MSSTTLAKVSAAKAVEVCKRFELSDEARRLLRDSHAPGQYFQELLEKGHHVDAVRFLAHALPKREAVWWACQCARGAAGPSPAPPVRAALEAAERWAADPNEQNRRAAMAAAEGASLETPAGCAAAAAFWSGGSLAPPDVPEVAPPESLTAQGVAGAILLAAVLTEPEKAQEKQRKFLAQGVEVANGSSRWKEPAAKR
jgi:hypothetical protein